MHAVDFKRQKCCSNPPFVRDTIHIARAYIMVNGKSIIVSCTRIFLGTKRTHAKKHTLAPRTNYAYRVPRRVVRNKRTFIVELLE